jgi:hypothetical protein
MGERKRVSLSERGLHSRPVRGYLEAVRQAEVDAALSALIATRCGLPEDGAASSDCGESDDPAPA